METTLGALASHGVLGVVAALAIMVAVWSIRAMREEMHFRIADATTYAAQMNAQADKDRTAQSDLAKSVATLAEVQRASLASIERLFAGMESLTRAIELREALRQRGSSGASYQAVRKPEGGE